MATQLELHDLGPSFTHALQNLKPGEVATIADHGKPVAQIVAVQQSGPQRGRGLFKGRMWMADDFIAPLPENELAEWEK